MTASYFDIKWKRSEEGYVESKCRRFEIQPIFIGRTTPQAFELYYSEHPDMGRTKIRSYCNTQREAKEAALSFLLREKSK